MSWNGVVLLAFFGLCAHEKPRTVSRPCGVFAIMLACQRQGSNYRL